MNSVGTAAVNAPQSKRFAKFGAARQSRQRLGCGGFSPAFLRVWRGWKVLKESGGDKDSAPHGAGIYKDFPGEISSVRQ